jgi:hypothetical protein
VLPKHKKSWVHRKYNDMPVAYFRDLPKLTTHQRMSKTIVTKQFPSTFQKPKSLSTMQCKNVTTFVPIQDHIDG